MKDTSDLQLRRHMFDFFTFPLNYLSPIGFLRTVLESVPAFKMSHLQAAPHTVPKLQNLTQILSWSHSFGTASNFGQLSVSLNISNSWLQIFEVAQKDGQFTLNIWQLCVLCIFCHERTRPRLSEWSQKHVWSSCNKTTHIVVCFASTKVLQ